MSIREINLGEVAEVQTGPFGSQLHMSDYVSVGTPIITVEHFGENRIIHSNLPLVSDSDKQRLIKYTLKEGDIVFSRVGSVDRRVYVTDKEDGWMFSGRCLRVRVNDTVNSKYLSYYFGLESFKEYIRMVAVGATMPSINTTILSEAPILIPPLPEQEAIAEVLSSLDDKIDLLHRNNKTLEQLAETLFRQWFVEQADDSWEEKSLDEIAVYLNGLALQKYPAVSGEETLPVIKIREMNQGITEATDTCSAKIPEQYIVRNGDILFSWSGSLDVVLWSGCDGALNQHLFKVSSTDFPKWLIYFGTKLFLPEFRSIAHDKATTMGHIQRKHLTQSVLKLPDAQKIKEYDIRMSGMVDKIISNNSQIKQLEQLRDTLLPKLMSGEVRVQDIKTTIPA